MKICLISNLYKPFNRGGAEKVCETIVDGLIKAGHEVFLITTKPRSKSAIINQRPPVYYINSFYYNLNKLPKFFRLFWQIWNIFNLVSYFKIKNILRNEKCDLVITNNLMGIGFLTPLLLRRLKVKHLHIVHDIQLVHPSGLVYYGKEGIIDSFFSKFYTSICRNLFSSPLLVIFPSQWLKGLYLKRKFFVKSKINVLPNPVEVSRKMINPRQPNNNNFTFLFLAQVEKHKGVFLLIEAFDKIKEKYSGIEVLIVGNGSKIKEAGLKAEGNKNIKFLGWPGDEAVDKLLGRADCLVYPSLVYENCPNAIQRALMAGLPVIGSDLGGICELLSNGAGILFKPANLLDFIKKIEWVINNKNNIINIAQAGQRRALVLSVENYIKEFEEILKL